MHCLYILHFDVPHAHANHYLGSSIDLLERLTTHANGRGARLTQVLYENDEEWTLAAIYVPMNRQLCFQEFGDNFIRALERKAKNRKGARAYCPICCDGGHVAPNYCQEYPFRPITSKELRT